MAKASSQKFIARNRAPRVQIEYDVETLRRAKRRFSCRSSWALWPTCRASRPRPLPPVADRKFLEIDVDNFDDRLKAMKPRVAFRCRTR